MRCKLLPGTGAASRTNPHDFCSGVPRLHAVQITKVCLVGGEDVREPPEVRLLDLSGRVLDGDLVLPDVEPV